MVIKRLALWGLRSTYGTARPLLHTRGQLPALLNRRGLLGRGAEIGVWRGEFSEHLLTTWRGRQLISVDPWLAAPPERYVDIRNVGQEAHDRNYLETRRRLERFGARSEIWRLTSTDAADRVAAGQLDFVYIDARHDFASVAEDIELWYPKVRRGGLLAGHDYFDGRRPEGEFGVRSAVDAFSARRSLSVRTTWRDRPWPSWYVFVP